MRIRERLVVCLTVSLLAWPSGLQSSAFAAQAAAPAPQGPPATSPGTPPPPGASQQPPAPASKPAEAAPQLTPEQRDSSVLSELIGSMAAGQQPAQTGIQVRWMDNHFIRSQGDSVYVPFTVAIDRSQLTAPSTALYVRVVSRNGGAAAAPPGAAAGAPPTYSWESLHFITIPQDGMVSRAIALPPGTYDAYVAVKDKSEADATLATPAAAKVGVVKHELTVPNFGGEELAMSSVLLAREIGQIAAPLPLEQQQDHPYTFVTLQVRPAHEGVFSKSGQLHLMFWIYNAGHEGGKPDIEVEYQFHHRLPDGELKYFNKTAPQALNAQTLPPEFDLTAGHQLLSNLSIPLTSFAEGGYRLEITVTDAKSGKSLTRHADFTVSA